MLLNWCNICIMDDEWGHTLCEHFYPNGSHKMESDVDRREFIKNATVLAGAAAAIGLGAEAASAQGQTPAPNTDPYAIKPLPFDPKSIKGLSEKIIVSHHDNNYAGAVRRLNAITAQLAALDFATAPVFQINGLKREELIAMNSMILHELYFDGLGGGGTPSGNLAAAIGRDFGSLQRWRTEFSAIGKAEGGGSGWVLLTYSPRDKRLVNQWAADHTTTLADGRHILALDMYEHAYHMDYGANAAGYVDASMEAIRWDNVAMLFDRYSKET
jgi:superoxide dismutase, Fe-Mn family